MAGYALVTCPYLILPFSGFNNYLFSIYCLIFSIIWRSSCLRLINQLFVVFNVVIEHGVWAVIPLVFRIGMYAE